jgi:hypothetical protein
VATDGRQHSIGLTGPAFTLLVAGAALVAFRRRRFQATEVSDTAVAEDDEIPLTESNATATGPRRPRRRLPRFLAGSLTGIALGVMLGLVATAVIAAANPEVRSAVIVGTGLREAPPTTDGQYVARILAQEMNPTLVFADPDVAAALALKPAPLEAKAVVLSPVEKDLKDSAPLLFGVFGALTGVSWALLMWGLSASTPRAVERA